MSIESMKNPTTREEFEYGFHLLRHNLENDKLRFLPQAMQGVEGIKKTRYLPNGRIDFLSVDESARSMANIQVKMSNNINFSTFNQDANE